MIRYINHCGTGEERLRNIFFLDQDSYTDSVAKVCFSASLIQTAQEQEHTLFPLAGILSLSFKRALSSSNHETCKRKKKMELQLAALYT